MDEITQLAGSAAGQTSAFESEPQTGAGEFSISPQAKNAQSYEQPAKAGGKKIAEQSGSPAVSSSARSRKPVMVVLEGGSGRASSPERAPRIENEFPGENYLTADEFTSDSGALDDASNARSNTEKALRQSQHELRQLSVRLLTIQENERQRIAADLHDGIGQSLSLLNLSMDSLTQLIVSGRQQEAVESLRWMTHKLKDAMAELRRTTTDLRPSTLDDLGIIPTLNWFFREFESVCREKTIERNLNVDESDVPVPLKPTIFRILQEAMNNIVKHAKADLIRVRMHKEGGLLQLSIEDNGQGFDPAGISMRNGTGRGFGLLTMKERARSSRGIFEIQSAVGQGTRIQISWRLKGQPVKHGDVETPRVRAR